ncbi:MAG: hypothetical protein WDO24_23975 [Pseudomonadota bacterium]
MRAIAQNREAALMVGVKPRRGRAQCRDAVDRAVWIGRCRNRADPAGPADHGTIPDLKAFALVIIGGLGNIVGAIAAAILLGLLGAGSAASSRSSGRKPRPS